MSTKKFSPGQRVLVNISGPKGQPGTIIGRGRSGVRNVWFVELD